MHSYTYILIYIYIYPKGLKLKGSGSGRDLCRLWVSPVQVYMLSSVMQVRGASTDLADSSIAVFPAELREKFGHDAFELVSSEDVHTFLDLVACDRIEDAVLECLPPDSVARTKVEKMLRASFPVFKRATAESMLLVLVATAVRNRSL